MQTITRSLSWVLLAAALTIAPGSVLAKKKPPQLTPMELQALQQKEFETSKETLFASVMSVFQDLGYTIDSADLPTGFITASSVTTNKSNFGEALFGIAASGNTRATAFVEKMSNGMARVRLNFQNTKTLSGAYGQTSRHDVPVLDPATYRAAWEKIDEALFVRDAVDSPSAPAAQAAASVPTVSAAAAAATSPQPGLAVSYQGEAAAAAKAALASSGCDENFGTISLESGVGVFEATCKTGKRQLLQCGSGSCKPLN
jgi:hypothetical protein